MMERKGFVSFQAYLLIASQHQWQASCAGPDSWAMPPDRSTSGRPAHKITTTYYVQAGSS